MICRLLKALGRGNITPRKIGYLLGYAQTFERSGTNVEFEFAHTDQSDLHQAVAAAHKFGLVQWRPAARLSQWNQRRSRCICGSAKSCRPRLDLSPLTATTAAGSRQTFPRLTGPCCQTVAFAYHLGLSQSIGLRYSDYREDPYPGAAFAPRLRHRRRRLRPDSPPPPASPYRSCKGFSGEPSCLYFSLFTHVVVYIQIQHELVVS